MKVDINDIVRVLKVEFGFSDPDITSGDENPEDPGVAVGYKSVPDAPEVPGLNINVKDNFISVNTVLNLGIFDSINASVACMTVMNLLPCIKVYLINPDSVIDKTESMKSDRTYVAIELDYLLVEGKFNLKELMRFLISGVVVGVKKFNKAMGAMVESELKQKVYPVKSNKIVS